MNFPRGTGEDIGDHQDGYFNMIARRTINEEFAEHPIDLNQAGLRLASKHTPLTAQDKILDIGTSSGYFAVAAAQAVGVESHIIGLEPDEAAKERMPKDMDTSRFTFVQGYGEDIPLPDNSVKAATAHNVLFRATEIPKMLDEMKRVTEPGGIIAISTNAMYHAFWRHTFERVVAKVVAGDLSQPVVPPPIPAQRCYLEELPTIIEQSKGLEIVDRLTQVTAAVITEDRLYDYVRAIKLSVNTTNLAPQFWARWRDTVNAVVLPVIENRINKMQEQNAAQGIDSHPYFADTIYRGLIIARNQKV
jgi:ubiquinone/menaquinone biosynthesis C-methylase UbiE